MPNETASASVGRIFGRGRRQGRRAGGVNECVCPKCGNKVPHTRGIACSTVKCPKCEIPMRGAFCL